MPLRSRAARVLVVEDDPAIALGLRLLLDDWGYVVTGVAASGERALALAALGPPDLVLMDVTLDGRMDGIATAAALRVEHAAPILFLTAQSDAPTAERLADADGLLLKPVAPIELRRMVDLLAQRRTAPVAARRAQSGLR